MKKECTEDCSCEMDSSKHGYRYSYHKNQSGNAVYGLGFIGAAVYFLGKAASFGAGVIGLLKAIVWPAFMVYEAFKFFLS